MSVYLSPGLVVSPAAGESPISPYIGWQNQVAFGNITADNEAAGKPITNVANPSTANWWLSASTAEQLVTVSDLEGETDYVGIAGHNFGSAEIVVSVEAITAEPGADWEVVHTGAAPADNGPLLLRFEKDFYVGVRLRLVPDGVAPRMAVLHVGELIVIPTGISPGYTPITEGRDVDVVGGTSVGGDFLGNIVTGASLRTTTPLKLLPKDWYETVFSPFVRAFNEGEPAFFAWSPVYRPNQVGYCWIDGSANPVISQSDGKYDIDIPMRGVA